MSVVPARSAAVAEDTWRYFTSQVMESMLASGEDATDTALYRRRRDEALAVLERKLREEREAAVTCAGHGWDEPAKEAAK